MIKRKRSYLKNIYKVNPATTAYMIEVSLDEYNEVFNGWDPSPIKRRDIDPDMLEFIEQCSFDIPIKNSIEIHFYLPKEQFDQKKENLSIIGITNNFKFIIYLIRRELTVIRKKILLYILLSFTFLILSYTSQKNLSIEIDLINKTLIEGMFIGGWVFLWEAFSLFFFSSQEIFTRRKRYRRLLEADIHFHYE